MRGADVDPGDATLLALVARWVGPQRAPPGAHQGHVAARRLDTGLASDGREIFGGDRVRRGKRRSARLERDIEQDEPRDDRSDGAGVEDGQAVVRFDLGGLLPTVKPPTH